MSLRLITIPLSHYCDKARWALERSGQPYTEEAHVQIFHYVATLRARAGLFVPALIHEGFAIRGSASIARWADAHRASGTPTLYPASQREAIERLEDRLDTELGVPSRLLMYHHAFGERDRLLPYIFTGVPAYQRWLTPKVFGLAETYLRRRLGVTHATARDARDQCFRVLDEVERMRGGKPFLLGDTFTAADLSFAAFAAPLTLPREYGISLPTPDELPAGYAHDVRRALAHPAGAFARQIYEHHRRATLPRGVA